MTKTIHTPLIRMSVVFGVLMLLSLWQYKFIISATSANVMLNVTIFATFFFGVALTYRNILRLKNEQLAYLAMREHYDDCMIQKRGNITDPLWRHYRCKELAAVYKKPDVLGPTYQLISEELMKNKDINLSPATMQTLLDAIDARLSDRKSLTQYVAGILVLLGLIGTFLGLMVTLASVGEILAAIDLTGSDPSAAIQNLMNKLQVPLKGMATGFSSSLFGLVTSLVLGLMVRFSAMAFSEFVQDIEGWMSTIVEIDAENKAAAGSPAAQAMIEEKRLSLIMRTARLSAASNTRINEKLSRLTDAIEDLAMDAREQRHALDTLVNVHKQTNESHRLLHSAMHKTIDAVHMISANQNMKNELVETASTLSRQLELRDEAVTDKLKSLDMQIAHLNRNQDQALKAEYEIDALDPYALLKDIKASLAEGDMVGVRQHMAEHEAPERDEQSQTPQSAAPTKAAQ
jgi:energy-coupling factor transporter transmembrane protein EcfT